VKIDELKRNNGIEDDPEGVFVRLSDLPQKRDAKTDPPTEPGFYLAYWDTHRVSALVSVAYCDYLGNWEAMSDEGSWRVATDKPDHWREILW
jgi:hypothetical protein